MPLPSDDVKALRKKVDDAISSVGDSNFTQDAVLATMRLSGQERAARIQVLAGTDKSRQEKLDAAAAATDKELKEFYTEAARQLAPGAVPK